MNHLPKNQKISKKQTKFGKTKKVIVSGLAILTVASLSGVALGAQGAQAASEPQGERVAAQEGVNKPDFNAAPNNFFRGDKKHGDDKSAKHRRRPRFTREEREALKKAIADKDYEAWAAIMKDRPITKKINADNFARFAEGVTLAQNGDKEGAKKIFDELGLKRPHRPGKDHPRMNKEKREAIKKALEAADYEAWLKAVGEDSPITKKINADNFDRLVEAYNLFKSGDKEGAKKIFDELGLKRPHRPGKDRPRRPGHRPHQGRQGDEAGGAHFGPSSGDKS